MSVLTFRETEVVEIQPRFVAAIRPVRLSGSSPAAIMSARSSFALQRDRSGSGQTWRESQELRLDGVVGVDILAILGSRADESRLAAGDVEELWQLVEFGRPEETSGPRDPRVAGGGDARTAVALTAVRHRPELEEDKRLPVQAHAFRARCNAGPATRAALRAPRLAASADLPRPARRRRPPARGTEPSRVVHRDDVGHGRRHVVDIAVGHAGVERE